MDEEADGIVSIKLNVTALTNLVSLSLSDLKERGREREKHKGFFVCL
jgi:hypothetical protein